MTEQVKSVRRIALPLTILLLGAGVGLGLVWTAPRTQPEEKVEGRRVVQVIEIGPSDQPVTVTAHGTVVPAKVIVMKPEVGGRIVRQHPALVPGGFLSAGEELIGIDPVDFELALAEAEALLEEARFEFAVERGRQVVAAREWELLERELPDSEVDRELVLREPHLRRTEALVRRAENEIAQARLDLERTSVSVPFNAVVLREAAEIGQLVDTGSEICTLVGADEAWLQAAIPVDDLRWVRLPDVQSADDSENRGGTPALVYLDSGNGEPLARQGRVDRLLTDLEPAGRMARVVVTVPDPFGVGAGAEADSPGSAEAPLLLGSYVRIEIDAGVLKDVLEIPRSALREGDRIWTVDASGAVAVHDVEILWARRDSVLIRNILAPGERLVVGGLRVAVPGTLVNPVPAGEDAEPIDAASGRGAQ